MASMRFWRSISILTVWLCMAATAAPARGASDAVGTYLERYHGLTRDDFTGRVQLAEFCRSHQLFQQACDLLAEAYKLRADENVYRDLIRLDGIRHRPVEKTWANKVEALLGPGFRLYHSKHFSVLTDMEGEYAETLLANLEQTYQQVYSDAAAIGLRPLPPAGRLLTILFRQYDGYRDYLQRYENSDSAWSAGHYSWRTNRCAFFHDEDNPNFAGFRAALKTAEARAVSLKQEMEAGDTATARRFVVQEQLKRLNTEIRISQNALTNAARRATLDKTRHEAAHQILFNSGLQRRGQHYPFWLAEGLATLFENNIANARDHSTLAKSVYLKQYQKAAAAGQLCSIAELFRYYPGNHDENERVLDHYAQAWALCHFLWNERPKQFAQFISTLDTPEARRSLDLHFARSFGDLNALQSAFKAHMSDLVNPANYVSVPAD